MKIGLIDVDGHNYPNLPLMKLSAWHKQRGDHVEWYQPMFSGHMDKVYMSKVFSFTPDYEYYIDADEVIKGGTGYAIHLVDGKEVYDASKDHPLPTEVEHIYPDYSLYPEQTKDTAYGFLTRGCPRGCGFCHVGNKEGRCSIKVADLSEFWRGQKNIILCDPNILACPEHMELLQQLIESRAKVEFNQGLDIRLVNERNLELLREIKIDKPHFAYDRYEDKDYIEPKFLEFRKQSKVRHHNLQVYVLCGEKEKRVLPEDLHRIYWLRDNGFAPYVMLFDKDNIPRGSDLKQLQRWVNNRFVFWKTERFEDYDPNEYRMKNL